MLSTWRPGCESLYERQVLRATVAKPVASRSPHWGSRFDSCRYRSHYGASAAMV